MSTHFFPKSLRAGCRQHPLTSEYFTVYFIKPRTLSCIITV